MSHFNRRDGFVGQQMIVLPNRILNKVIKKNALLEHLYITQIGYFPHAAFHYRERRKGCADNIMLYCIQGKGWYVIGKNRYTVSANEYVILPATDKYMRYGADKDDPWTIYWVHFTGTTINMFNQTMKITAHQGPRPIRYNEYVITLWTTIYQSFATGLTKDNIINGIFCLHAFLASFLFQDMYLKEPVLTSEEVVEKASLFMKVNIDKKMAVEDFAAHCNISASYLSYLFRNEMGKAPLEYFIQLKIHHACMLLVSTKMKIKEIAAAIGYDDPYYFSRIFKKMMTISPKQYMYINQKES